MNAEKIADWISCPVVKDVFTNHFLRTGEMDEQDEITGFRLINTLSRGLAWVEVQTTGWVLDARALVDENSNFIALA